MKAIITVDVPEHQIGQEVSAYFKDTMCVKGKCEAEIDVLAKHDEEVIKETVASIWGKPPYTEMLDEIRAEIENLRFGQPFRKLVVDECLDIIDKYRKGDMEFEISENEIREKIASAFGVEMRL